MAKDVAISIQAEKRKNPLRARNEVVDEGRKVYMHSCAFCHGVEGRGRTDIGRAMYPPALDFCWAVPADLVVLRISFNFVTVIVPATVPLTVREPANDLAKAEARRVKRLLAVGATVVAHRGSPGRDACLSL